MAILANESLLKRKLCNSLTQSIVWHMHPSTILENEWKEIACLFNSPSVNPEFSFRDSIAGANPSALPQCERSAETLVSDYAGTIDEFHDYLEAWRQHGAKDSAQFRGLLPKLGRALDAQAKKAWILFKVCRFDVQNADILHPLLREDWCGITRYSLCDKHKNSVYKAGAQIEDPDLTSSTRKRRKISIGQEGVDEIHDDTAAQDFDVGHYAGRVKKGNRFLKALMEANEMRQLAQKMSDDRIRAAAETNHERVLAEYNRFNWHRSDIRGGSCVIQ